MKSVFISGIIYVAFIIAALVGEVKCIVKMCQCDFEPSYKAEVFYTIGTFTGAGAVIGYLDLGK